MIYTDYYSHKFDQPQAPKSNKTKNYLGAAISGFGMGYLRGMSKEDKAAMTAKVKDMLGIAPATQAPAPVRDATPTPTSQVDPLAPQPAQTAAAQPPEQTTPEPASDFEKGWNDGESPTAPATSTPGNSGEPPPDADIVDLKTPPVPETPSVDPDMDPDWSGAY